MQVSSVRPEDNSSQVQFLHHLPHPTPRQMHLIVVVIGW